MSDNDNSGVALLRRLGERVCMRAERIRLDAGDDEPAVHELALVSGWIDGMIAEAEKPADRCDNCGGSEPEPVEPECVETAMQLLVDGPTRDGDLVSKAGRNKLVGQGLVERFDGWQWLNRYGMRCVLASSKIGENYKDRWRRERDQRDPVPKLHKMLEALEYNAGLDHDEKWQAASQLAVTTVKHALVGDSQIARLRRMLRGGLIDGGELPPSLRPENIEVSGETKEHAQRIRDAVLRGDVDAVRAASPEAEKPAPAERQQATHGVAMLRRLREVLAARRDEQEQTVEACKKAKRSDYRIGHHRGQYTGLGDACDVIDEHMAQAEIAEAEKPAEPPKDLK